MKMTYKTLCDWDIKELKNEGHMLLEEYIALDISHRSNKQKRIYAYTKLARKLEVEEHKAHFGYMTTRAEIIQAKAKLKRMIYKRKCKIEHLGLNKIKFAPNLAELQKNIKPKS